MVVRGVLSVAELDRLEPAHAVDLGSAALHQLARDLVDSMRAAPGCVGLAAPQIGVSLRAFVIDVSGHKKTNQCHGEVVLFNPVLVQATGREVAREGSMSVPDLTGDVARSTVVTVEGVDVDARPIRLVTDAFEARAMQHELDHLEGLTFLDRIGGPHGLHQRRVYKG